MIIGGFQKFTLSDFPGRVASIIFLQGCNFRCPFCHNGELIQMKPFGEGVMPVEDVLGFLRFRTSLLDGVVITGGEPTIHRGLAGLLRKIKGMGFEVKLDTNGSRPDVIRKLVEEGLVDYIAMDVKAPPAKYAELAGKRVETDAIMESIEIIADSGLEHLFRTTEVTPLLGPSDIMAIKAIIPSGSSHMLQPFKAENALSPQLRAAGTAAVQDFSYISHPHRR